MNSCTRCGGQAAGDPRAAFAAGCRVLREIDSLHSISSALALGGDFQVAMSALFAQMEAAANLHAGLLAIVDRERSELVADEAAGLTEETWKRTAVKLGEGLLGGVAASGDPMLVEHIEVLNTKQPSALDRLQCAGLAEGAWLAVPIKHGPEVLGTLSFRCPPAPRETLEAELRFLVLIAGQVGLAVRFRQLAKERFDSLRRENERLQEQLKKSFVPDGMIGKSSAMRVVYFHVDQVADSKTTVLIRGETGVGKERIAQAIWQGGVRRGKPFVRVNCAALPESIIESELFGHEKGAFTGALALRKGRFELAHGGTLFLDEIGEVSLATQAKLLRVLQEGTFERVGGAQTVHVDVRVITATNRNLEKMIEDGRFRLDLYYRINVFPIYMPPLRERKSDILELADYFLEKYSRQNGKKVVRLSTPAIDMLMSYHWPGNVRELENVIERAVLLSQDGVVHGYHLPPTLQTAEASGTVSKESLQATLDAVEREMIVEALTAHGGTMAKAARQLGLTERIMGLRVKKHGIDPARFREAGAP
ncbi:MAG TPA: sigma 54-interacting transcriptional regulator [Opitutaceae bacterium]